VANVLNGLHFLERGMEMQIAQKGIQTRPEVKEYKEVNTE
jgi:hypothetical protein